MTGRLLALVVATWIGLAGAAHAQSELELTPEELVEDLITGSERQAREAAVRLGSLGEAAVPALVAELSRTSGDERERVLDVLKNLGPLAAEAAPALAQELREAQPRNHLRLLLTLRSIGPGAASDALPVLIEQIEELERKPIRRDYGRRTSYQDSLIGLRLETIASFDQHAIVALPLAAKLVRRPGWRTPPAAAKCLAAIGLPALPSLITALDSPNEEARREAAQAIADLGPPAASAVPALLRAEAKATRIYYRSPRPADTLVALDTIAVPGLLASLTDPELGPLAAQILRRIGVTGPHVVRALVEALESPHRKVATAAARSLAALGPKAAPAIPALREALRSEHAERRWRAAEALGDIGPESHVAVDELVAALGDPDPNVRNFSDWALTMIGEPSLTPLIAQRRSASGELQERTEKALQRFGHSQENKKIVHWWTVPRAYAYELVGLCVGLLVWFTVWHRFPRRRPASKLLFLLHALWVTAPALVVGLGATHHVLTVDWTQGFLSNKPPLGVLPLLPTALLSVGFCVVLGSIWACWGKDRAEPVEVPEELPAEPLAQS